MDLWIGVERSDADCALRLEGRLAGTAVAELDRVARELEPPIRVDLSQLFSADDEGIAALQSLRASGAELIGTRPVIEQRIESTNNNRKQG